MADTTYCLFPPSRTRVGSTPHTSEAAGWRIAVLEGDTITVTELSPSAAGDLPESAASEAVGVAAALTAAGCRGGGVLLAIPSSWCLAAPVSAEGLPRQGRRQALIYRLEEKLPISAEDFVADFIEPRKRDTRRRGAARGTAAPAASRTQGAGTGTVLGICVEMGRVAPVVSGLESAGVEVEAICPVGLLALAGAMAGRAQPVPPAVLIAEGHQFNLFILSGGSVTGWLLLPADGDTALRSLLLEAMRGVPPLSLCALGLPEERFAGLSHSPELRVEYGGAEDACSLAARAAPAALAGRGRCAHAPAMVDLRRDALRANDPYRAVRRPLRFATAACLLALLCITGSFAWRARTYQALAASLDAEQAQVFRTAMPGQPVPPSIKLRLESEARRLRGISGASSELPPQPSALATLHEVLRRLPTALRYRVLELRIDGDRLYLDGQARSHGEADLIAAALRKAGGPAMDPPKTEQLSGGGVSFTLTGTAPPPAGGALATKGVAAR